MQFKNWPSWCLFCLLTTLHLAKADDDDYNVVHRDGSFQFGYNTPDSYHYADANRRNVVRGKFGGRNPSTGAIDSTIYTAGPRGYRPQGKNIVRKYDLNQNGPRPIGSRDDPYFDPLEDPSYNFEFKTRVHNRQESANRLGDVNGRYSYIDDVGERHNVEYIAGKNTGFHVKTPFPDSNPRATGPLYFNGRGKPIPRGRTSIQRGLDGSYRFVSAGPDQRRTETSDSTGHVRGSYTYLDDKGVQHSVHYIAGPEIGYRVLKNVKGPHLPTVYPFGRPDIIPSDFYDYGNKYGDDFDTAASGHIKPVNNNLGGSSKPDKDEVPTFDNGVDVNKDDFDKFNTNLGETGGKKPSGGGKPFGGRPSGGGSFNKPSYEDDGSDDFGDLFGSGGTKPSTTSGPSHGGSTSSEDDGSYKPSSEDGAYKPTGSTITGVGTTTADSFSDLGTTAAPSKPSGSGNIGGRPGRPRPGLPPTGVAPGFFDNDSNEAGGDDNFNLFGSETGAIPPPKGGRPIIQIGQGTGAVGGDCSNCKGTIVTNVGDRLFSVPPGVSVRAHVQSIDLLPVNSNVPSPSEQFKADTNRKTEQLNSASSSIVSTEKPEKSGSSTTLEPEITTLRPSTTTTEDSII